MMSATKMAVWVTTCLMGMSVAAEAQKRPPGSLLLFAEYDSQPTGGMVNLITVTNSDRSPSTTVDTKWVYVDGQSCSEWEYLVTMPSADTLTVVSHAHHAQPTQGYLYVYAMEQGTDTPIVYNHLIGTSTILDGVGMLDYTVDPFSYRGIGSGEFSNTDVDLDGVLDLDGWEYEQVSNEMLVPRFLGQDAALFDSQLVLVDLTGGRHFDTTVGFEVHNDNEELITLEYEFNCWTKTDLLDISAGFSNQFLSWMNHDPNEVLGWQTLEAGWMRLNGVVTMSATQTIEDPAIVCLLVDRGPTDGWRTSVHPFGTGIQDNGTLPADAGGKSSSGDRP